MRLYRASPPPEIDITAIGWTREDSELFFREIVATLGRGLFFLRQPEGMEYVVETQELFQVRFDDQANSYSIDITFSGGAHRSPWYDGIEVGKPFRLTFFNDERGRVSFSTTIADHPWIRLITCCPKTFLRLDPVLKGSDYVVGTYIRGVMPGITDYLARGGHYTQKLKQCAIEQAPVLRFGVEMEIEREFPGMASEEKSTEVLRRLEQDQLVPGSTFECGLSTRLIGEMESAMVRDIHRVKDMEPESVEDFERCKEKFTAKFRITESLFAGDFLDPGRRICVSSEIFPQLLAAGAFKGFPENCIIYDVGSAAGANARAIREGMPSVHILGIEPDLEEAEGARSHGILTYRGDVQDTPSALHGKADLVMVSYIQVSEDPNGFYRALGQLVAPTGRVFVGVGVGGSTGHANYGTVESFLGRYFDLVVKVPNPEYYSQVWYRAENPRSRSLGTESCRITLDADNDKIISRFLEAVDRRPCLAPASASPAGTVLGAGAAPLGGVSVLYRS
jgi:hypothetical protein